jgi:hypothetical protein
VPAIGGVKEREMEDGGVRRGNVAVWTDAGLRVVGEFALEAINNRLNKTKVVKM